ncbi:MAG: flavodoxin family protein [Actinobacteria bacterium]|nr:flavodoxin family protein [Actinomycetota bacterium]
MNALVIYESLTGNTRRAAEAIVGELTDRGVAAVACPTTGVDYAALEAADLVIVGTWTDGIFVVGQRPARGARLRALPSMLGKRAVVFCTYALDAGRTLEKLVAIVEGLGAEVLGGMTIRRDRIDDGARDLVGRVLDLDVAHP